MIKVLLFISNIFDSIERYWEKLIVKKYMGPVMVLVYLFSLFIIELKRRSLLPDAIGEIVPYSHFAAANVAFSLFLIFEVIDLIFGITSSFSRALGKQLEIFAIILLRNCFKSFSEFNEPITWPGISDTLLHILSSSFGALIIILLLVVYYRMLQRFPICDDSEKRESFIYVKKLVSLFLFLIFIGIGAGSIINYFSHGVFYQFFPIFFTVLILCDIFMVLVALGYSSSFPVVFRNAGFAVSTVLLRLALTAPYYYDVALGIIAAVYVIGITLAYNFFASIDFEE
ncbi:MAG: hypothetical protein KAJ62_05495 [Desulfobacteraceae bacterium]|nr:hypothetical protein [Desulfobacteraceae bacterium]